MNSTISALVQTKLPTTPTTYSSTPGTGTTKPTKTIESITIITGERGEVVEQKESYNPDTKEVTLSVPAHGDNVALTAIIGVDKMVTSYDNYCIVGDPPADHTTAVSERSRSTNNVDEFDSGTVRTVYSFNVVEGELTDAERAELPESFQSACKDKPIQKTKRIEVDQDTFQEDSYNSVVTIRRRKSSKNMDSITDSFENVDTRRRRIASKEKDSIRDSLESAYIKGRRRIAPKEKDSNQDSLDRADTKGRRRIAPKEKDSIQDSLDSADTKGRRRIVPKEKNLKYETLTFDLSFSITSRQGQVDCSSPKVQYRLLSVIFN